LPVQTFHKHRSTVLGLAAASGAKSSRHATGKSPLGSKTVDAAVVRKASAEVNFRGAVLTSAGRLWDDARWKNPGE
jgi:hypothetical protein